MSLTNSSSGVVSPPTQIYTSEKEGRDGCSLRGGEASGCVGDRTEESVRNFEYLKVGSQDPEDSV